MQNRPLNALVDSLKCLNACDTDSHLLHSQYALREIVERAVMLSVGHMELDLVEEVEIPDQDVFLGITSYKMGDHILMGYWAARRGTGSWPSGNRAELIETRTIKTLDSKERGYARRLAISLGTVANETLIEKSLY